MSTVFKYEYLVSHNGFYPCLRVVIEHDEKTASFALIDSGSSDETYIPRTVAKSIGLLDLKSKITTSVSASGKFEVYRVKLKALHIVRHKDCFTTFRYITVRVPTEKVKDLPFVVLGRSTIFKRYDITFSEKRKKIILAQIKKLK